MDIPEVALVASLDADKEGFLRSEMSLIQTIGRAARNSEGHVILYADTITGSMRRAMDETARRREIQKKYNEEHGIVPQTIKKDIRDVIESMKAVDDGEAKTKFKVSDYEKMIAGLTAEMMKAAENLEFEQAAELRDRIRKIEKEIYNK